MYLYPYLNILTEPNIDDLHIYLSDFFSYKGFIGCTYDQCVYNCEICQHLGVFGYPLNSLKILFSLELSSEEKLSLDNIVVNYL